MITVTGTLMDAVGNAITDTLIRVTSLTNDTKVKTSYACVEVDGSGSYSFDLTDGLYSVEVLYKNCIRKLIKEYSHVGNIMLTAPTGSVTLEELMNTYQYTD